MSRLNDQSVFQKWSKHLPREFHLLDASLVLEQKMETVVALILQWIIEAEMPSSLLSEAFGMVAWQLLRSILKAFRVDTADLAFSTSQPLNPATRYTLRHTSMLA